MKRSEINAIMREADAFITKSGFHLPPFAYWTIQDWRAKEKEAGEIVATHLRWISLISGAATHSLPRQENIHIRQL